jgi:hypothetical protein
MELCLESQDTIRDGDRRLVAPREFVQALGKKIAWSRIPITHDGLLETLIGRSAKPSSVG